MKTSRILKCACVAGAILLLSAGVVSAQATRATQADSSLAARLQRLEDMEEIRTQQTDNLAGRSL